MVHQVIYCFRGWIAFAAFIDLGTAIQCFIDADSYLSLHLNSILHGEELVSCAMARLLGIHRVLAAMILIHCAFCIHHAPVVSMTMCSCILTIVATNFESFYYQTAPLNFYTIFPVIISIITLIGLVITPSYLKTPEFEAQEEKNLLKMTIPRKKNWNKKRS